MLVSRKTDRSAKSKTILRSRILELGVCGRQASVGAEFRTNRERNVLFVRAESLKIKKDLTSGYFTKKKAVDLMADRKYRNTV